VAGSDWHTSVNQIEIAKIVRCRGAWRTCRAPLWGALGCHGACVWWLIPPATGPDSPAARQGRCSSRFMPPHPWKPRLVERGSLAAWGVGTRQTLRRGLGWRRHHTHMQERLPAVKTLPIRGRRDVRSRALQERSADAKPGHQQRDLPAAHCFIEASFLQDLAIHARPSSAGFHFWARSGTDRVDGGGERVCAAVCLTAI